MCPRVHSAFAALLGTQNRKRGRLLAGAMLSDSPLLTSAASMLQRLELSDSSIALPLVVFGIHSLLALLGGLLLLLLLRCRRTAVSKYRLFASVMRMQKEMQPTTIISAAALTVGSLVQPAQGELRLACTGRFLGARYSALRTADKRRSRCGGDDRLCTHNALT